jgi:AmmeMemoRadiSam system protein B
MSIRQTAVAGQFYPNSQEEIEKYIQHFNKILDDNHFKSDAASIRAVIAPHAGYVYSGFTANAVYRSIDTKPKRVIVIGPSHRVFVEGASVSLYDEYRSPLGNIPIDKEFGEKLIEQFDYLDFSEAAHHEHSTETQIPFVKHYMPDVQVVEIVYGRIDYRQIEQVIETLFQDPENFIVISTDLSHFYTQDQAKKLDNICLSAIANQDLKLFDQGCEACGIIGVKAMVAASKKASLRTKIVDYRTSYDASGDASRVVGYTSVLIY